MRKFKVAWIVIISLAIMCPFALADEFSIDVDSVSGSTDAKSVAVPIRLNRTQDVSGAEIVQGIAATLSYDPSLLGVVSVSRGASIPAGWIGEVGMNIVSEDPALAGVREVRITYFEDYESGTGPDQFLTDLDPEEIVIATVYFDVNAASAGTADMNFIESELKDGAPTLMTHLVVEDPAGGYSQIYQFPTGNIGSGIFTIEEAAHTISIPTPPLPAEGSIIITPNPVPNGGNCTIQILPNAYLRVDDVILDGGSLMNPERDPRLILNESTGVEMLTLTGVTAGHDINQAIGPYYGDANGSRSIGVSDALVVLEHDAGFTTIPDFSPQAVAADVNANTSAGVGMSDALLILEYDAKRITEFPVEP